MKQAIRRILTFPAILAVLVWTASTRPANACAGPPIVFFGLGSVELSDVSKAVLDWALAIFRSSEERIMIAGHADRAGRLEQNLTLSRRRAEAVRDHLIAKGISPGRIQVEYYGESRPLVDTADEVAEPQNRNVSMWINGWCGPPPTQ